MQGESYTHWAWMLRDMRIDALRTWRNDYAPAISTDDLYANHLRRTRIVCDELPGGIWTVGIKIQPRRAGDAEWYWWKIRKIAGMYYIL
jgi:hypothetical protein